MSDQHKFAHGENTGYDSSSDCEIVEIVDPVISKKMLAQLIAQKSEDVELKEQPRSKSSYWENFFRIFYRGKPTEFACCRQCRDRHIVRKTNYTGTSVLKGHKCHNLPAWPTTTRPSYPSKNVPASVTEAMSTKLAIWLSMSQIPSSIIEDDGFRDVIREAMLIGYKYGPDVEVDDILLTAATVSKHVDRTAFKLESEQSFFIKREINSE